MGVSWTSEQQKVIDLRNRNILVSAAAGSGKTAVLVERIIQKITSETNPVDIDRLLIVTFTNAAAAEMRERIGVAIEKKLGENPEDEHLQRQLTLLHNAQITTIDSFCLYVIRNHFHEIDLEPNFRIADEGELKLLREDVLKKVLERNYSENRKEFHDFVEGYASGRTDDALNAMILQLFSFSRSYPWPKEWLEKCASGYEIEDEKALNEAFWLRLLTRNINYICSDMVKLLEQALLLTRAEDGPFMYESAIQSDLLQYQRLEKAKTFTEIGECIGKISYETLSRKKFTGDVEKQEQVKALRQQVKDMTAKLKKQYFYTTIENTIVQLQKTRPMAEELVRLTLEFSDAFAAKKREKNLVDFSDLEHFALQIFVDERTKELRRTADEFCEMFEEIMIDEYQDSNQVQESILSSISRKRKGQNNMFMVGDVKQSIYRFRLASPEIFMEKYDLYPLHPEDEANAKCQRIDLHKNFRSREEVLGYTNDIFYKIMARDLGNVQYDADAALYPGASYPKSKQFAPELLLVDSQDELLEDTDYSDKKILEAKVLASRIKRLLEEQPVTDKETGELRPAHYRDMVILLRSLNGWADRFAEVLAEEGIPAHTVSATGYFSATEVQVVLSMLKILDNPMQDIPLTAVLYSPICGLGEEDLAKIRLAYKEELFHVAVLKKCQEIQNKLENSNSSDNSGETLEEWENKLAKFWNCYQKLRALVPDTPIHNLIEILLKETGYGNYAAAMPAGERRRANLAMLLEKAIAYENTSYKGLFHFVRYIEELQKYDVDFGEADTVGENEDVVRIMSIHKSKGLEFPIVFVSGLGKNFNKQDVRSKMVLHPVYGAGLDFMDGNRRLKSPTLLKRSIAKQIDMENLGEELRVLYVALTRAKEKLILTGSLKDAGAKLEAFRTQAECQVFEKSEHAPLSYLQRESATSYLDWILPALYEYHGRYPVTLVEVAELVTQEIVTQVDKQERYDKRKEEILTVPSEQVKELEEKFSFRYPRQTDVTRKNKYSVSELKHRAMREKFEEEQEETVPVFLEEPVSYVPKFMQEVKSEEVNQGALRGTAVHRVMECYDFTSQNTVKEQIERLLLEEKLTKDMADLVKQNLIEQFIDSDTGMRMCMAAKKGQLYREKPFVMGFCEEELNKFGFGVETEYGQAEQNLTKIQEDDLTLIQGIIDVFWMEEDGIVLLDYKTDRVKCEQELIDRYQAQLALYAESLERIYTTEDGKRGTVKEKLIYSFSLGKLILVP